MWVPFISKRSDQKLYRRQGGGGGGMPSGSSGPSVSSSSSGSLGAGRPIAPISSGGTSMSASSFGNGGGNTTTIPSGQLFAGRSSGGGTRAQVYGNQQYGSGYPGIAGRGVMGRGFPFVFWPLAWGGIAGAGSAAYLHNSECGRFDNSSRPGGIMMTAAFTSSSQNTTYRLLADKATVTELISDIMASCSSSLSSPNTIVATNYTDALAAPKPEQVIQYYRASSIALSLDGYNDTAAWGAEGTPDTPLPTSIDMTLLNCLNTTIGAAAPLVDAARLTTTPSVDAASLTMATPSTMGLIGLAYVVWSISSWI